MKYITKHHNLLVITLLLVVFSGCTTFLFQSVKTQIVGTWQSDPVLSNPDTWTFNNDGTCTLVFHAYITKGGADSIFYEPASKQNTDTTLSNVPYTITSSTGRYYLTIDAYATLMGYAADQFRFIIVKVNSKEMYLESQILYAPAQTGYIQISFTKQ
jgi:hypothetical protein